LAARADLKVVSAAGSQPIAAMEASSCARMPAPAVAISTTSCPLCFTIEHVVHAAIVHVSQNMHTGSAGCSRQQIGRRNEPAPAAAGAASARMLTRCALVSFDFLW
jgi:hypothetical protein